MKKGSMTETGASRISRKKKRMLVLKAGKCGSYVALTGRGWQPALQKESSVREKKKKKGNGKTKARYLWQGEKAAFKKREKPSRSARESRGVGRGGKTGGHRAQKKKKVSKIGGRTGAGKGNIPPFREGDGKKKPVLPRYLGDQY